MAKKTQIEPVKRHQTDTAERRLAEKQRRAAERKDDGTRHRTDTAERREAEKKEEA